MPTVYGSCGASDCRGASGDVVDVLTPMRVIRVTVDRRAEGIRVAVAMSPSVLDEVVQHLKKNDSVRFKPDDDLTLEPDLAVVELVPDEIARVEFEREAEDYVPVVDQA
jgi:hypothetical protein